MLPQLKDAEVEAAEKGWTRYVIHHLLCDMEAEYFISDGVCSAESLQHRGFLVVEHAGVRYPDERVESTLIRVWAPGDKELSHGVNYLRGAVGGGFTFQVDSDEKTPFYFEKGGIPTHGDPKWDTPTSS